MSTIEHEVHVFWEEDQLVPSCSSKQSDSRDAPRTKSIKKTKSWNSNLLAVRDKKKSKSTAGKRIKFSLMKSKFLQSVKLRQWKAKMNEKFEKKKMEKKLHSSRLKEENKQLQNDRNCVTDRVKLLEQTARAMRLEMERQAHISMMVLASLLG